MKKIICAILSFAALLSLSSCEDWLQATSSTQFQADQIFDTRDGYIDALTGVYLTMGNSTVYGANTTWRYTDVMTYVYETFTSRRLGNWQQHNYSHVDVRSDIASIWEGYYNIIANANMVLSKLDQGRGLFSSEVEFNLVKGELLAIRAYVHFDLMRLFGVCSWGGENASKLTIPYVTEYGMTTTGQLTYAETEKLLLADVEEALMLLADDPVTGVKPEGFDQGPNADGYWDKRQRHLNLYAVEALAARIYLWKNDLAKAEEYARKALGGAFGSSLVQWLDVDELVTTYKDEEKDWTFSCEHIFGLEITGLNSLTTSILADVSSSSSDAFKLDSRAVDILFSETTYSVDDVHVTEWLDEGYEDIRGTALLLRYSQGAYECFKLYGTSTSSAKYRNLMPMIRLTEMYYIIAFCCMSDGRDDEARRILDDIRLHRGIQEPLESYRNTPDELEREVFKEFLNEGQTLYWRRLFQTRFLGQYGYLSGAYNVMGIQGVSDDAALILPYPDDEIDYGRRQDL